MSRMIALYRDMSPNYPFMCSFVMPCAPGEYLLPGELCMIWGNEKGFAILRGDLGVNDRDARGSVFSVQSFVSLSNDPDEAD